MIAASAGTTVATAYVAPSILPGVPAGPPGERGPEGPMGPEGPKGAHGKDGADGADGVDSTSSSGSGAEEDLAPNKPEYRAYCADLYERWQEGSPITGERDKEAIQEYGDALCHQG